MKVSVSLFAQVRLDQGDSQLELELPDGATLEDLSHQLEREYPAVARHLPSCRLAVGMEYAEPGTVLQADDDVAVIPPVQGG